MVIHELVISHEPVKGVLADGNTGGECAYGADKGGWIIGQIRGKRSVTEPEILKLRVFAR